MQSVHGAPEKIRQDVLKLRLHVTALCVLLELVP